MKSEIENEIIALKNQILKREDRIFKIKAAKLIQRTLGTLLPSNQVEATQTRK
jgi:hypothetical protein